MPKLWHKKRISIHAPTRGATMSVAWYQGYNSISIHAPTRGATSSVSMSMSQPYEFQSTLPREERLLAYISVKSCFDFNPRSHERSDVNVPPSAISPLISIHAPTRGATTSRKNSDTHMRISIHAPTRGATHIIPINGAFISYFNPRSHERSDQPQGTSTYA